MAGTRVPPREAPPAASVRVTATTNVAQVRRAYARTYRRTRDFGMVAGV
jgi:hypothetical protein